MRIVYTNSRLPVVLRNAIWGAMAALLVSLLLIQAAHACNVTDVFLHIGI